MNPEPPFDGSMIKRLRKRANLTQSVLAAKLGVSQSLVSHWEKGSRQNLTEGILKQLEILIGMEVGNLVSERVTYFCTNVCCSVARWVSIDGVIHVYPFAESLVSKKESYYCGHCGSLLRIHCEHCRAGIVQGKCICVNCGKPYAKNAEGESVEGDADRHNAIRMEILGDKPN